MIYTIVQSKTVTQYHTYEVEANNPEEAMEKVLDGDAEVVDYTVDDDDIFADSQYEVIDFRESKAIANDNGPDYDSAGYSVEDREQ